MIFMKIGATIWEYISIYLSLQQSEIMYITIILVDLDLNDRLLKNLCISMGLVSITHPLDYIGLPFLCNICHRYVHLVSNCAMTFSKRIWKIKEGGGLKYVLWYLNNVSIEQDRHTHTYYSLEEGFLHIRVGVG